MFYKDFKVEFDIKMAEYKVDAYVAILNNKDESNERIRSGAFTKTIRDRFPQGLIKAFWRHTSPMGMPNHIEEDTKGLFTSTNISKTEENKDRMIYIADGVVDRASIGYNVLKDNYDEGIRDLLELKLFEYSFVPIAANEETYIVSVKSVDDMLSDFRSLITGNLSELIFKAAGWDEQKPYPNEHSARLQEPDKFNPDTFRRTPDGTIYGSKKVPATADVIWGKLKGHDKPSDNPIPQAIRFPIKNWTADEAKKWLKDNNITFISFEAASKSLKEGRIISSSNRNKIKDCIDVLQMLMELSDPGAKEKSIKKMQDSLKEFKDFNLKLKSSFIN